MVTFVVRWLGQQSQVSCNFCKRLLHRMEVCMCVNIQRHSDIGVSHEILQTFHINAPLLHIRTEGVAQNMGRYPGKGISIDSVDFLLDASPVVLQVHSNIWHILSASCHWHPIPLRPLLCRCIPIRSVHKSNKNPGFSFRIQGSQRCDAFQNEPPVYCVNETTGSFVQIPTDAIQAPTLFGNFINLNRYNFFAENLLGCSNRCFVHIQTKHRQKNAVFCFEKI